MNYPVLIYSYSSGSATKVLNNCTECKITESSTDFQLSMTLDCNSDAQDWNYGRRGKYVEIRDIIRARYLDGNDYDFKVESVSYSDGVYSITAKHLSYEFGGVANKPIVGMFTPKGMIDFINANTLGISIDSSVSCSVDDRYFGISSPSHQLARTTLYSNIIGATGYQLKPTQRGLTLVKDTGRDKEFLLSDCVTSLSVSSSVPDKPHDVIGYSYSETNGELYANSLSSTDIKGEGEFYDASSDMSASLLWYEGLLRQYCDKKLSKDNPKYLTEVTTLKAELAPNAPLLQIGDRVKIYDGLYHGGETIGWYDSASKKLASRVSQIEYDSLNNCMVSISVGDISSNIADTIAEQSKSVEGNTFLENDISVVSYSDFDENGEYQFTVSYYNNGDVVLFDWDNEYEDVYVEDEEGELVYDRTVFHDPRISAIDGNVFTFKVDNLTEDSSFNLNWWLYYIQRTEHSLYDEGDLCDLTWTNYSTSYLSFDTAQISLKSGGAPRACTNETISLTGYKRLVIEYELTTYKDTYVGLNTTVSTSAAVPDAFYCKLAKGGTKASVEIPDAYLEYNILYLKIYGKSGVVGKITKIYLQSK